VLFLSRYFLKWIDAETSNIIDITADAAGMLPQLEESKRRKRKEIIIFILHSSTDTAQPSAVE
jgi:hypothetical protein